MSTQTRTTASPTNGQALWAGAQPVAWYALAQAVTIGLLALVRVVLPATQFDAQQLVSFAVVALGQIAGWVAYGGAMRAALRHARDWQGSSPAAARTALITAAVSAVVIVLPVVVAVLSPQHPAL